MATTTIVSNDEWFDSAQITVQNAITPLNDDKKQYLTHVMSEAQENINDTEFGNSERQAVAGLESDVMIVLQKADEYAKCAENIKTLNNEADETTRDMVYFEASAVDG